MKFLARLPECIPGVGAFEIEGDSNTSVVNWELRFEECSTPPALLIELVVSVVLSTLLGAELRVAPFLTHLIEKVTIETVEEVSGDPCLTGEL